MLTLCCCFPPLSKFLATRLLRTDLFKAFFASKCNVSLLIRLTRPFIFSCALTFGVILSSCLQKCSDHLSLKSFIFTRKNYRKITCAQCWLTEGVHNLMLQNRTVSGVVNRCENISPNIALSFTIHFLHFLSFVSFSGASRWLTRKLHFREQTNTCGHAEFNAFILCSYLSNVF